MEEDRENEIVVCKEYHVLYSRSSELFEGLRDLPRFGVRHWHAQFIKTFNIFTKLWKYQAEHRSILTEYANLKRHEIGEIASRVGQLYYHYYLHTSNPKYLIESCEFYAAILSRNYFQQDHSEFDLSVALKSLRCLARYLVVALILRDYDVFHELTQKLQDETNAIGAIDIKTYDIWTTVVKEAKQFVNCEHFVVIVDEDAQEIDVNFRLAHNKRKVAVTENSSLKLQSAVVIGGCEKQVKFNELTMDMYRILLLLEYTPDKDNNNQSKNDTLRNPTKHLLYKPTFAQIYAYVAAVFKNV